MRLAMGTKFVFLVVLLVLASSEFTSNSCIANAEQQLAKRVQELYESAITHLEAGEYEKALEYSQKVLDKNSRDAFAYSLAGTCLLNLTRLRLGLFNFSP